MHIRARNVTQLATVTLSAAATALAIGVMPRTPPLTSAAGSVVNTPKMSTVTPDRLATVIGQKYRLRFDSQSGGDRVQVSSADLDGGGRFDVVLFGSLPRNVRGMACEVTQVDQQGAAALLAECARVAAGDRGAPVVASWIHNSLPPSPRAQTDSADSADPAGVSAVVGVTRYALRALPAGDTWVLSMRPDD